MPIIPCGDGFDEETQGQIEHSIARDVMIIMFWDLSMALNVMDLFFSARMMLFCDRVWLLGFVFSSFGLILVAQGLTDNKLDQKKLYKIRRKEKRKESDSFTYTAIERSNRSTRSLI